MSKDLDEDELTWVEETLRGVEGKGASVFADDTLRRIVTVFNNAPRMVDEIRRHRAALDTVLSGGVVPEAALMPPCEDCRAAAIDGSFHCITHGSDAWRAPAVRAVDERPVPDEAFVQEWARKFAAIEQRPDLDYEWAGHIRALLAAAADRDPTPATHPDGAPVAEVARYLLGCANGWDPDACIVGDCRAADLARVARKAMAPAASHTPSPTDARESKRARGVCVEPGCDEPSLGAVVCDGDAAFCGRHNGKLVVAPSPTTAPGGPDLRAALIEALDLVAEICNYSEGSRGWNECMAEVERLNALAVAPAVPGERVTVAPEPSASARWNAEARAVAEEVADDTFHCPNCHGPNGGPCTCKAVTHREEVMARAIINPPNADDTDRIAEDLWFYFKRETGWDAGWKAVAARVVEMLAARVPLDGAP